MHRPHVILSWFVVLVVFTSREAAAAPDASAKGRAAAYQKAARAVLAREHWRITVDQPGRLVAQHLIFLPYPAGEVGGYNQLTITFRPKSITDTECGLDLVGFLYGRKSSGDVQKSFSKPVHLTSPEATDDIQRLLGQARKHLAAEHPEYFASTAR